MIYKAANAITGDGKWRIIGISDDDGKCHYECCELGHDTVEAALYCPSWKSREATIASAGRGAELIQFIGVNGLVRFNPLTGLLEWTEEAASKLDKWLSALTDGGG